MSFVENNKTVLVLGPAAIDVGLGGGLIYLMNRVTELEKKNAELEKNLKQIQIDHAKETKKLRRAIDGLSASISVQPVPAEQGRSILERLANGSS